MVVPDSLEGAIVLSVIDFVLSIVVIWGISLVLYAFPRLNDLGQIDEEELRRGH